MRSLWIIISTLAVANLLALAGFVGWLATTDRLNKERIHEVRELLAPTITEVQAAQDAAEQQRVIEAKALEEAERSNQPPLSSEHKIKLVGAVTKVAARQQERLKREAEDLARTLEAERAELDNQREAFVKSVAQFDERRATIMEQEGSEQFSKAVKLYQSLKPPVAKAMMSTLIRGDAIDTVVAYLNALQTRKASQIVAEFEKDDPTLAADLLERIKQMGTEFEIAAADQES